MEARDVFDRLCLLVRKQGWYGGGVIVLNSNLYLDLCCDSMGFYELLMDAEDEFDVELCDEIDEFRTLNDIVSRIMSA